MAKTPRIDRLDKNLLINGNFEYWQRATIGSTPGYIADRWAISSNWDNFEQISGSGLSAISRFAARLDMDSPSGPSYMYQRVESVFTRNIESDKLTLTFQAKVNSGDALLDVQTYVPGAVDDYTSSSIEDNLSTTDLTASFQKFTFILDVTQQMKDRGFELRIGQINPGVSSQLEIGEICLHQGELDDPEFSLAGKDLAEELQLCQRYYEKSYDLDVTPGTSGELDGSTFVFNSGSSTQTLFPMIEYKVTKRVKPSNATWAPFSGNANNASGISGDIPSNFTSIGNRHIPGNRAAVIQIQNMGSGTGAGVHWAVDAEL